MNAPIAPLHELLNEFKFNGETGDARKMRSSFRLKLSVASFTAKSNSADLLYRLVCCQQQ